MTSLRNPSRVRLPTSTRETGYWQESAACNRIGLPEKQRLALFFGPGSEAEGRGPAKVAREQIAKRICLGCPVRDDCLEHALSMPEVYGVWGAMGEDERRALTTRRDRRRSG